MRATIATLALALTLVVAIAASAQDMGEGERPAGADDVTEAIQPTPSGPERGPERTVAIYEETAAARRAWYWPPAPRRPEEPWRYGTFFFLYSTRNLCEPEERLPRWARWAIAPFAAALDVVDLPWAAVAGLYGD